MEVTPECNTCPWLSLATYSKMSKYIKCNACISNSNCALLKNAIVKCYLPRLITLGIGARIQDISCQAYAGTAKVLNCLQTVIVNSRTRTLQCFPLSFVWFRNKTVSQNKTPLGDLPFPLSSANPHSLCQHGLITPCFKESFLVQEASLQLEKTPMGHARKTVKTPP